MSIISRISDFFRARGIAENKRRAGCCCHEFFIMAIGITYKKTGLPQMKLTAVYRVGIACEANTYVCKYEFPPPYGDSRKDAVYGSGQ